MEISRFRKEMAESFIAALQEDIIPWHRSWSVSRPVNAVTGTPYHGINMLWLSFKSTMKGYTDPRWCTYMQAKNAGWQVKRNEKGCHVEFFTFYDRKEKKNITAAEAQAIKSHSPEEFDERIRIVSKTYTVFNGSQIDDIPEYVKNENEKIKDDTGLTDCRDRLIKNMEVGFKEGGNKACYVPSMDTIHMPEAGAFESSYAYMSTFLHESAHATGNKKRLNRDMSGTFGSEKYAVEELRAEIASAFTAQLTGINYEQNDFMENHKAYVQNWISVLQNNPNELFRAIKDAEKISDYLIEKGEFVMEQNKDIIRTAEEEESLVEGVEFAIDSGMYVSDEDIQAYNDIMNRRKSESGLKPEQSEEKKPEQAAKKKPAAKKQGMSR